MTDDFEGLWTEGQSTGDKVLTAAGLVVVVMGLGLLAAGFFRLIGVIVG